MKFSELWLRELVNPDIDSITLVDQITMAGLEVDKIEPVPKSFHGVIVGEIIECTLISNTDSMYITKISIGDNRLIHILCNNKNCRQNIKVAVAPVGAILPNKFEIQATKLYGKLSEGILCSFYELGLSAKCSDIIEFSAEAIVGTDIHEYLKLDDNTIEISITPNRSDCFSVIGIARDIAALNDLPLNIPKISAVPITISDTLPVFVEVTDICPCYIGRIIKDINIRSETPLWIREKLRRSGITSINSVVDVINYVFLELGQPIHVFDLEKINGGIIVRLAKNGEFLVLSNGNEIKLDRDILVVSDYNNILAIGGIISGAYASLNKETSNVFLECSWFAPCSIADIARRYNIHTDISHRYECGVDPALQKQAMERITSLLLNVCGGKAGPIIDHITQEKLPIRETITLRRKKIDRLLGYHINTYQVINILQRLGCEVSFSMGEWRVVVPSWRFDITLEEDLIEEVARIYGYKNIPNILTKGHLVMTKRQESHFSLKRAKTMLVDKGYQEVITYSFVDPKIQTLLHPEAEALNVQDPISSEMSVMRLSLWTGLLSAVLYNQSRQQNRISLFESGFCFIPDKQENLGIRQDIMLAGVLSGNRYEEHWNLTRRSVDFYDLKGDLEAILDLTGELEKFEFRPKRNPALHPGKSAGIYLKNEHIGYIGLIHPELEYQLNLNSQVFLFELLWNKVSNRVVPTACEISRFPTVRRDISIVVDETIPVALILDECRKFVTNHLVSVNLFDVYRGKEVNTGCKSLAISLIFQDINRTLEEDEVTEVVSNCIKKLKELFKATLRS